MTRHVAVLFLLIGLAGCGGRDARLSTAAETAQAGNLRTATLSAEPFRLAAFVRLSDPAAPVVVYIEGDGLAWASRHRPSSDPTPNNPVGLALAALDPSPNVAYIARPCQYVGSPACTVAHWTDARFSEQIVRAMSQAVDQLVRPGQGVHLVGYSGGGAVAALLAARRGDVLSLRTVAGNLDHDAVNRHHRVSPLLNSLNAIRVAGDLAKVPQIHYAGQDDAVVPPFVAASFVQAQQPQTCATTVVVPGATHHAGWEALWRRQAGVVPACAHSPSTGPLY